MNLQDLPRPLGESAAFGELLENVSRVAAIDRSILVVGERGTGKELVAARLHYLSTRWEQPFVKVNCATLTESLLESELFGHEAGAFTGAVRRHVGRFERAHTGTLFLDEIATASLRTQEKLLRVLEYGELERVGGNDVIEVDVRVVAASNVDLPQAADAGQFRHDLLDRLAFEVITVPPLRDRYDDVELLAEHFAGAMAGELELEQRPSFSAAALDLLRAHPWPGNVRELRNAVERAVARLGSEATRIENIAIDPFESPYRLEQTPSASGASESLQVRTEPPRQGQQLPTDLREQLRQVERDMIEQALDEARFHQGDAARLLGLSYHQLRHLLKKHSLQASSESA